MWYKGDAVADSRVEAWEFIVGGGASFNHLNGRYTIHDPAGATPDNVQVCGALRNLATFMQRLYYWRMRPVAGVRLVNAPPNCIMRGIGETDRQYALYLHHSAGARAAAYVVEPGEYRETIALTLTAGAYRAEWVDPASGQVVRCHDIAHTGGECRLTTPAHAVDIALCLKRVS